MLTNLPRVTANEHIGAHLLARVLLKFWLKLAECPCYFTRLSFRMQLNSLQAQCAGLQWQDAAQVVCRVAVTCMQVVRMQNAGCRTGIGNHLRMQGSVVKASSLKTLCFASPKHSQNTHDFQNRKA